MAVETYHAHFVSFNNLSSREIDANRYMHVCVCANWYCLLSSLVGAGATFATGAESKCISVVDCQCSSIDEYGLAKRRFQKSLYARKVEHFQHGKVEVTVPPVRVLILIHSSSLIPAVFASLPLSARKIVAYLPTRHIHASLSRMQFLARRFTSSGTSKLSIPSCRMGFRQAPDSS